MRLGISACHSATPHFSKLQNVRLNDTAPVGRFKLYAVETREKLLQIQGTTSQMEGQEGCRGGIRVTGHALSGIVNGMPV